MELFLAPELEARGVTPAEHEAFREEAARKRAEYEAQRRHWRAAVFEFEAEDGAAPANPAADEEAGRLEEAGRFLRSFL